MNVVECCLLHGLKTAGADRAAVMSVDETLSYGQLAARVSQFAAGLTASGLRPGDRVAMLMFDTPDLVAMHLATMAAGGIAVAVSTRASADELAQTLAIAKPYAVVVDAEFDVAAATAMAQVAPQAQLIRRDRELRLWKGRDAGPLRPVNRAPVDPAFWVMTSGTTGQPKAVEHHHGTVSVCGAFPEQVLKVTPADRAFTTSCLHFAYALSTLFGMMRAGATSVLLERWATSPSVAATVERFEPTIVLSVPSVYHRLIEDGLPKLPAFGAVRCYVSAGERLPPRIWNAWHEASGRPILDCLGCSESMYMIVANRPDACRPGSSGLSVPGVEVRIVDEFGKTVTEPAQSGRLEVRTPSICSGYRDVETGPAGPLLRPAERFRGDDWFATGDEYMLDDEGYLHHRGRTGDMLRVSGMWISPSEIEDALAGVPSIADAAAVLGEGPLGLAEIVLYVVPAPGVVPSQAVNGHSVTATARERLEKVLPSYKLPRRFEAVDDLPRTASGKVQRHKLRDLLRREAP
ncbi:MAG: AMP-binding protein [Alphaproteobacteria bacterium]|nr:AMP-binding protein [Alphaproteobacteria bacterium]